MRPRKSLAFVHCIYAIRKCLSNPLLDFNPGLTLKIFKIMSCSYIPLCVVWDKVKHKKISKLQLPWEYKRLLLWGICKQMIQMPTKEPKRDILHNRHYPGIIKCNTMHVQPINLFKHHTMYWAQRICTTQTPWNLISASLILSFYVR